MTELARSSVESALAYPGSGDLHWSWLQPVVVSLRASFPENSLPAKNAIDRIQNLSRVLHGLNELGDLGVSAEMRLRQPTAPDQFRFLLHLRNLIGDYFKNELARYQKKYGPQPNLILLAEDSTALSRQRHHSRSPEFQEMDNLLFILACSDQVCPGTMGKLGILDENSPCCSIEDFRKRYGHLVFSSGKRDDGPLEPNQETPSIARIRGLLAVAMTFKVRDDEIGYQTDRVLGLPNITNDLPDPQERKELIGFYTREAADRGFPPWLTAIPRFCCNTINASTYRWPFENLSPAATPDDVPLWVFNPALHGHVRERLDAASALVEAFR